MQYAAIRMAADGEPPQVVATGRDALLDAVSDFLLRGDIGSLTLIKTPLGKHLGISCKVNRIGVHVASDA